jgi:hypothetical protein
MNVNQIVNMIVRIVLRRLVNGGINAGLRGVSRLGSRSRTGRAPRSRGDGSGPMA